MITKGSVVQFAYTLSDDDGRVIYSNKGELPVTYPGGVGLTPRRQNFEYSLAWFGVTLTRFMPRLRGLSAKGRQHFTATNLQFDPRVCENLRRYPSLRWIS